MNRRVLLKSAIGLGALGVLAPFDVLTRPAGARALGLQWRRRALLGFGTTLSLQAAHADPARADKALDAAVSAIRRIEAQMSLFDPASALSRLNRHGVLHDPPPELVAVLRLARKVSAASDGAFDVTVQPLWTAFETARRQGRLPSPEEVAAARTRVDWSALEVSDAQARFSKPGMAATLNGVAQGFAADLVRRALKAHGVEHALINTGEWTALGRREDRHAWTLGIADPHAERALLGRLALDGRSVAVSADNQTAFSADRRYHHIFDPRTGTSPPDISCVVVAANTCARADVLTKVLFVAGKHRALHLAQRWQADALVVDKDGDWQATEGLRLRS